MKTAVLIFLFFLSAKSFPQTLELTVFDTTNSKIPSDIIKTLSIDAQDNIWFVTGDCFYGGDLVKYDGTSFQIFDSTNSGLRDRFVTCIAFDSSNVKWIGSRYSGLYRFDDKQWTNYNPSNSPIPDKHINCIIIDRQKKMWLGTDKGLAIFDGKDWMVFNKDNSLLPDNKVNSIAFDKFNSVWIATDQGILTCFQIDIIRKNNPLAKTMSSYSIYNKGNSKLKDNYVSQILIDKYNTKWISYWGGVIKANDESWTVFTPDNSGLPPYCEYILTLDDKNLWVSTNLGLVKYDGKTWNLYSPKNSMIPGFFINRVALDSKGNKWIASQSGLIILK